MATLNTPSVQQGATGWGTPLIGDLQAINAEVASVGAQVTLGQVKVVAVQGATTATVGDPSLATVTVITLTQATVLNFPLVAVGKQFMLVLKQDATGGRAVTWPTNVIFAGGGTAPTLTTTANRSDVIRFTCVDGLNWIGWVEAQNIPAPSITPPVDAGVNITLDDNWYVYTGSGWMVGTEPGALNSGDHWTQTTNDTATFNWVSVATGTIALLCQTKPSHGIMSVTLDGGAPVDVDLYDPVGSTQVAVWTSGSLTATTHSVVVKCTGRKNASSAAYAIEVDAIRLVKAATGTGSGTPPSGGSGGGGTPVPTGFLTRSGSQVLLNGTPWRATGVNNPWWAGCGAEAGLTATLAEQATLFANAKANSVYRYMLFGGNSLAAFDAILNAARPYGHRFIVCLSDRQNGCAEPYCGPNPTAFYNGGWISGGWRDNHLTPVINRYKNEPLIGWWEWVNEPDTNSAFRAFVDACGAYVRNTLGDQHLIGSGTMSEYGDSASQRLINGSNYIDLCSMHEYDWSQAPSGWTSADAADAAAYNKPFYVGESGITPSQIAAGTARANQIKAKIAALHTSWPTCCAYLYWSGAKPGFPQGDRMEIGIVGSPEINVINTEPF